MAMAAGLSTVVGRLVTVLRTMEARLLVMVAVGIRTTAVRRPVMAKEGRVRTVVESEVLPHMGVGRHNTERTPVDEQRRIKSGKGGQQFSE